MEPEPSKQHEEKITSETQAPPTEMCFIQATTHKTASLSPCFFNPTDLSHMRSFSPTWVLTRYHVSPWILVSHTPSVLLCLWRIILPLAGEPEEQWDTDGGQSHHSEGCPVQLRKRKREAERVRDFLKS